MEKETSRLIKLVAGIVLVGSTLLPLSGCFEYHRHRRSHYTPRHNRPIRHFRSQRRPYRRGIPKLYRRHR